MNNHDMIVVLAVAVFAMIMGLLFGFVETKQYDEQAAVTHGAGYYNTNTAVFEWKK
jgi:nitrogen fixation-related uncharacterized protein